MIACLGWGSLLWNPDGLPINGEWQEDGPILPLEFERVSENGRITLVIADCGAPSPVLWVRLAVETLEDAIAALGEREGVVMRGSIGRIPAGDRSYPFADVISVWAVQKELSGVVWTALKPGLPGDRGRVPTLEELREHIDQLSKEARADALEYVQRAPAQIRTKYREALQDIFTGTIGSI